MKFADNNSCVQFVEQTYFANVRDGNIEAVMQCFEPDATVIIRHGDKPERVFTAGMDADATALEDFYQHLCGNYDSWFGNFSHFIDLPAQKSACHFQVRLNPKAEGLYADAGVQELRNCNFFVYNDMRISHMIIYYSNPQADGADRPTGYPGAQS
jgi:hypothetical protein